MSNKTNNSPRSEVKSKRSSRNGTKPRGRRKPNSGVDYDDSKVRDKDFGSKGCNDIAWYAQDATLLRNVANFPWSTQSGLTYDDDYTVFTTGGVFAQSTNHKFTNPGILSLSVLPGLGKTNYQLDAVNIAANAMYVFIRHMNSGAKNYDAPDLMNYILAMDEVFSFITFCQRLYGTLGMYNVYNRYLPDALIKMQGVDPNDLRENMVQFRYRLNTIIKQAATLVVPATFPVFERHAFLFRDYYIEGNDMKDQIYLYTPVNFRKFQIPAGGGPGELVYDDLMIRGSNTYYRLDPNGPLIKSEELLDYLQDMVKRIYLDEDFGIMAGDILKAYGEGKVVRLSEVPDAYVCTFKQNNEVLLQMKNCNIAESAWKYFDTSRPTYDTLSPYFGNIYQDPNTNIISENLEVLMSNSAGLELIDHDAHMLTLEGDPSPEMNMIMSRLIHGYVINRAGLSLRYTCGTELVLKMHVCFDVDPYDTGHYGHALAITPSATDVDTAVWVAHGLSCFKYHPNMFFVSTGVYPITAITDVTNVRRLFQVDNFTILSDDIIDRLNQVAIMSEFNVPHMALT